VIISVTDDFDLKKIADSGQCFRVREFPDGTFRFITGTHILYLRRGSETDYEVSCDASEWAQVWRPYFDLERDYAAVRRAIPAEDVYLTRAAAEGAGIRILRQDCWETLATFIISQRKNIPAIKKAVEALSRGFGTPIETPLETVYTFPAPVQLTGDVPALWDNCRLGYRLHYIQDAVGACTCGCISLPALGGLDDAALLASLKEFHGVGEKVANCVALFAYGRTALAPVDVWIRRIIDEEYGGVNPFPAYGDAAGIMQQYAFFYARQHRHPIP